jgi:hypothetical protein
MFKHALTRLDVMNKPAPETFNTGLEGLGYKHSDRRDAAYIASLGALWCPTLPLPLGDTYSSKDD